jgi:hypothetical protein
MHPRYCLFISMSSHCSAGWRSWFSFQDQWSRKFHTNLAFWNCPSMALIFLPPSHIIIKIILAYMIWYFNSTQIVKQNNYLFNQSLMTVILKSVQVNLTLLVTTIHIRYLYYVSEVVSGVTVHIPVDYEMLRLLILQFMSPKVAVKWLAFLRHIQNVPYENFGSERGYFFWWWRQYVPLKRRSTIILHSNTSQKTILNFTTGNVTISCLMSLNHKEIRYCLKKCFALQ